AALRLAQERGVIAEIGRIISSTLDIEEVYERFAEEVRKLIPFDQILVDLVNHQEGTITTAYTAGMEGAGRWKGVLFPIAGTVTEQMIRTKAPVLFHPETAEEVHHRFPGLLLAFQAGLRSRLSVPLIARGEVIGSLALWSKQQKAYGKEDIRLAQAVAGQIAGAIANAQLFRERKLVEERLRFLSFHDELTGLYNRRGFHTLCQQQIKLAERTRKGFLFIIVDLDQMKWINDTLGHQAGDKALTETANILKQTFRGSDIMGRVGGDEFAILTVQASGDTRQLLAQRLRESLDARNNSGDHPYTLSFSTGIASYDPEHPSSLDDLMAQADTLMYEEKRGKRDQTSSRDKGVTVRPLPLSLSRNR
ncbi:MAG: sensor domain-containing diguanylate cyclase, partial [Syntrophales bacterium LBB04]|nr:sensor domain-containing diguanylate cyclase [Syntrophales bacterium LBB04]